VSYLFIAIVWANHHNMMRYATETTPRLMWVNFAHLFSVSLLPLATAWMAASELAKQAVAFYAAVFFPVNLTYIFLILDLLDDASAHERKVMRFRSLATLGCFGAASVIALWFPIPALALCCICLTVYLKPDAPDFWVTHGR
jgi:TMEM175 potassium channel family protein